MITSPPTSSISPMRFVIVGAAGRMGCALIRAMKDQPDICLHAAITRGSNPMIGQDSGVVAGLPANSIPLTSDYAAAFAGADGVIDFTSPAATLSFVQETARNGLVHVIGTTGMNAEEIAKLETYADRAIIIRSGNFSLGVNMLAALVEQAARALAADWDVEIIEMHHRKKVDAPSGTALLLGEAAARGRNIDLKEHQVLARVGVTGARPEGAIGFQALRGGSVIGDHNVIFAANGERLELRHIAEDRSLFANGAIKAALWGKGRQAGLYSMRDVLGCV